ncbi:MAG: hypothetical protein HZB53_22195 [Chloroflexi bacterium]|nr:hypothetical protein [Chloroflexota bacterium]
MQGLSEQDAKLFAKLSSVPTDSIWTELDALGYPNMFIEGVRPVHRDPDRRLVGRAVTLRYLPVRKDMSEYATASGGPMLNTRAAEEARPGDVMVVDAGGESGAGFIGDVIVTRFVLRGGAGLVVDGAVRDLPALRELDLALYTRHVHAAATWRRIVGVDYNVPVRCGGVTVLPGDILVGDGMGVIVIPPAIADLVVDKTIGREDKETFIRNRLLNGASIYGIYPPNEQTTREYEEYKQQRGA